MDTPTPGFSGWPYLVPILTLLVSALASGHAILHKRDPRAAALWVGFIWFVPWIGALLYALLGVNRIRRRAILLRGDLQHFQTAQKHHECPLPCLASSLPKPCRHLVSLAQSTASTVDRPLLSGNRLEPLFLGDTAFPAMLDAIATAQHSISLATYIFDRDEAGLAFAKALGHAARRGVAVRVLIDATGVRYSYPSILSTLRSESIPHARFLRTFPLRRILEMNLRNHRKLLVIDGRLGFTGGMNLRIGHWLARNPRHPVQDLHFQVQGPVVAHLQEVFADDWFFTTGEALRGSQWFPPLAPAGDAIARGIADGPDEDFERLRWTLLGALAAARHSIRVATPYFLPDATLIAALNLAAMRGVEVRILLPSQGNLPFVQWASAAQWWQVLERGCRIWLSPPPFDHSKVCVVDDCWSLVGSTNWDPRSLRLNFEFNVESYDPTLAQSLTQWFDTRLPISRETSLAEVDARSLPVRLRDGVARLFAPFL